MFGTMSRVTLIAFIPYIYCRAYARGSMKPLLADWCPLLGLLPLPAVFAGVPLAWALRASLIAFTLVFLSCHLRRRRQTWDRAADRHCLALLIILLIHLFFNGYFSMLPLKDNPFHGPANPETEVMMQLFRSFVWIKQFSLSSMDYSYWLMGPHTPLSHASPTIQLLSWLTDSPSADILAFHQLLHRFFFLACVGGSFGFYLLLNVGLRVNWGLSAAGGMLYVFGQEPFFSDMLTMEYINGISCLAVFPFALCAMFCAFRGNSGFLAVLSGATLASSFIMLPPHLDTLFLMLLCFGILTLAASYSIPGPTSGKDRLWLIIRSGIGFTVLCAFYMGPILLSQLDGELYTHGHSELDGLGTLQRMGLSIPISVMLHLIAATQSGRSLYSNLRGTKALALPMTALALVFLLTPVHSPLLVLVTRLLHTEANLLPDFYGRRGCFIAALTWLLVVYAIDRSPMYAVTADKLKACFGRKCKSLIPANALALLAALIVCALIPLRPHDEYSNPQHCPYYVMLDALLANYPLLKGDPANALAIRDRLTGFERDIKTRGATDYDRKYRLLLEQSHIAGVSDIADASSLYVFARKAAPLVDGFYFDALYSCVHPAETKYGVGGRTSLLANVASLYSNLPTPFLRLAGFTSKESIPEIIGEDISGNVSLGIGPGLFIHNSGGTYDARFMIGPVLPHALYLKPGFDFQPLGSYNDNISWYLSPTLLLHPLYRKVFDIAGIDVVLVPRQREEQIAAQQGFVPLPLDHPQSVPALNNLAVLRNRQSYGMAYLANRIRYVPESAVIPLEKVLRRQLIKHDSPEAYEMARTSLYAQLDSLHGYHDIILEDTEKPSEDAPAGGVTIRNILGEAAVMKADCRRTECELVYNIAKLPGWHAYADGKPLQIARANFAFMAVRIPRGIHEVWFVYAPLSTFCFTMLSLLGFILLPVLYRRRNPE
jgi:hypothetical protein